MPIRFRQRMSCLAVATSAVFAIAHGAQAQTPNLNTPVKTRPGFSASQSPLGNYLAGRFAEGKGDVGEASDYIVSALAHDPNNLSLLQRACTLLVGDGRFTEAAVLAPRIFERDPTALTPSLVLAIGDLRKNDFAGAQKHLAQVPQGGINRVLTPIGGAWLMAGQGKTEAALDLLNLPRDGGLAVLGDFHAALIAELAGNAAEAEARFERALAGQSAPALRLVLAMGSFYERHNRIEDARKLYRRYLDNYPDSRLIEFELERLVKGRKAVATVANAREGFGEALLDVASVLHQQNLTAQALTFARLTLAVRPDRAAASMLLAEILEARGKREQAVQIYAAIDKASNMAWSGRLRGALLQGQLGQIDAAAAALEAMAKEEPTRYDSLIGLGDIYRGKDRFADAVAAYDRGVARIPQPEKRHWAIFYSRGIANERSKNWPRGEADFLKALDLQPEQPLVLNYLAYSWIEQGGNIERAKAMLERAVQLRPNDGAIVDSMGWALYRLGEIQKAVDYLERAIELHPSDPTINDHLGDAYWRVGRRTEARFQWSRALLFKPEPELIAGIENKLKDGLPDESKPKQGG